MLVCVGGNGTRGDDDLLDDWLNDLNASYPTTSAAQQVSSYSCYYSNEFTIRNYDIQIISQHVLYGGITACTYPDCILLQKSTMCLAMYL